MTLDDYLSELPDAEYKRFCEALDVDRNSIGRYRKGERIPKRPHMVKIFKLTNGLVQPNDFYPEIRASYDGRRRDNR